MELKVVGLHIGRTAGTSFYQFMEAALGMEHCFPISAFGWGQQQGRITPHEFISSRETPLFTYGHYVHESWIEYLRCADPVLTFSFFRDPVDRRVSLSRHFAALDATTSGSNVQLNLIDLDIWCAEVLRCFPTATSAFPDEPRWRQAFIALSALDHLLPMDGVKDFAHHLVGLIGNEANIVEFPALNGSASTSTEHHGAVNKDDQDGLLFEAISSGARASAEEVAALREATRQKYPDGPAALAAFKEHLLVFMRAEFDAMATLAQNVRSLQARRSAIDELLAQLPTA